MKITMPDKSHKITLKLWVQVVEVGHRSQKMFKFQAVRIPTVPLRGKTRTEEIKHWQEEAHQNVTIGNFEFWPSLPHQKRRS
jgi:hypothetical protein